jgi:hypothetical protein
LLEKEDYSRHSSESKKWRKLVSTAMAAAIITFSSNMSALADLNKFEAATRGEFGIGSAAQFGSADLRYISLFVVKTLCLFFLKLSVCCYAGKQYM